MALRDYMIFKTRKFVKHFRHFCGNFFSQFSRDTDNSVWIIIDCEYSYSAPPKAKNAF